MKALLLVVTAFFAGIVQGIAGFGSGPVQMMTYTAFWPLPVAAAISVCVSVPLNLNMLITYLKKVKWRKVLLPAVPYIVICSAVISVSRSFNQALMKKIFGGFLVLLAIYYLFFSKKEKTEFSVLRTLVYITVSAVCDALFGIGGPLMVLYFLGVTKQKEEYLGNTAAFFLINGVYNTVFRLISGILSVQLIPYVLIGTAAILTGVTVSHRLVDSMDDDLLRRITYVMIGLTGILNMFC